MLQGYFRMNSIYLNESQQYGIYNIPQGPTSLVGRVSARKHPVVGSLFPTKSFPKPTPFQINKL